MGGRWGDDYGAANGGWGDVQLGIHDVHGVREQIDAYFMRQLRNGMDNLDPLPPPLGGSQSAYLMLADSQTPQDDANDGHPDTEWPPVDGTYIDDMMWGAELVAAVGAINVYRVNWAVLSVLGGSSFECPGLPDGVDPTTDYPSPGVMVDPTLYPPGWKPYLFGRRIRFPFDVNIAPFITNYDYLDDGVWLELTSCQQSCQGLFIATMRTAWPRKTRRGPSPEYAIGHVEWPHDDIAGAWGALSASLAWEDDLELGWAEMNAGVIGESDTGLAPLDEWKENV